MHEVRFYGEISRGKTKHHKTVKLNFAKICLDQIGFCVSEVDLPKTASVTSQPSMTPERQDRNAISVMKSVRTSYYTLIGQIALFSKLIRFIPLELWLKTNDSTLK